MLAAIWAQDDTGLIGINNHLPWHLPNDLKFFKQMTEHNTLVMGRKTFEGMGGRPLPNRETIVLTRDTAYQAKDVRVMHTKAEVLEYARNSEGIVFIAGGTEIYRQFLPDCAVLYRTVIHHSFNGDAYFPEVSWDKWTLISQSEGETDEKNPYTYDFETYQRIKNQE